MLGTGAKNQWVRRRISRGQNRGVGATRAQVTPKDASVEKDIGVRIGKSDRCFDAMSSMANTPSRSVRFAGLSLVVLRISWFDDANIELWEEDVTVFCVD